LDFLVDADAVEWDAKGQLRDPARGLTFEGSNVYNLVNILYTVTTKDTAKHLSTYVPTAFNIFINKVMEVASKKGTVPTEVLNALTRTGKAQGSWSERVCNGRKYNLVRMLSVISQYLPFLQNMTLYVFIPAVLALGNVKWSWFCNLYDWLTAFGQGNPATNSLLQLTSEVVDAVMEKIPDSVKTAAEQTVYYMGDSIPGFVFSIATNLLGTIASIVASFFLARRAIPRLPPA
jgi:hypothetical protein